MDGRFARPRPMLRRTLVVLLALGTVVLVGCKPPPKGARVLVLGDSLTAEARRSGEAGSRLANFTVDWSGSLYGSAPCNGIAAAAELTYVPDVVVIAYSGNRNGLVENCMDGESGGALRRRYVQDVTTLIDRFDNGRTRLVVVGGPTRLDHRADADAVFSALRTLAATEEVAFVDGGTDISPDRTFRTSAACLPTESTCGTAEAGRNTLRDSDGVHFCPAPGAGQPTFAGECNTYSSGAVRYTLNLLTAINRSTVAPA